MSEAALTDAQRLEERFEGFSPRPYRCPAGVPTIGFGRVIGPKGAPLPAMTTTAEAERAWLRVENLRLLAAVVRLCKGPLTDGQLAALIDFCYNLGTGNLQASTLRQKLLRGDYDGAADELLRWVYGCGKRLRGLVLRRAAERELFVSR